MLIFGCGYVGHRVARQRVAAGKPVWAVTRSSARAALLRAEGITPLVADVTDRDSLARLPTEAWNSTCVLLAIGFDRGSGRTIDEVYVEGLRRVLDTAQAAGAAARWIYLSSTGVYGDFGGEWVDEDSPCDPPREGGRACLRAERLLAEHRVSAERHVTLRLAGIYGPGRLPRVADLRAGRPIPAPDNTWLNLIHVEDVVQVVELAESAATPSRYCVSDGRPIRRHDYYRLLASLAGA